MIRCGSLRTGGNWHDDSSIILPCDSMAATDSVFEALAITVLWSARAGSVLRRTNVAIGNINELDIRRFFKVQSTAASLLNIFSMWVFRTSSMTSKCRKVLHYLLHYPIHNEQIPLRAFWHSVRKMSLEDSSTSVVSSSGSSHLIAAFLLTPTRHSREHC